MVDIKVPIFKVFKINLSMAVVYFNHQMGAPHTIAGSKSIFLTLKQLFSSLTEQNKEKRQESCRKTCNKRGSVLFEQLPHWKYWRNWSHS